MEYVIGALFIIGGFFGSFAGSYMKKKGENLATHEDIDKLVEQVEAVTTTTKQIEAKISSDMWDRQKRWELKREVLFEAVARVSELEDALVSYDSILQVERGQSKGDEPAWIEKKTEELERLEKATTALDVTRLLVSIVCGKETKEAFNNYRRMVLDITGRLIKADVEVYKTLQTDRLKRHIEVEIAVRKELGLDGPN